MMIMNEELATTTSITNANPPTVYSFGNYKYITYGNDIYKDELIYEDIEYISRIGFMFPKIIEKIRIVLSHFQSGYAVFTPTEQWIKDVGDLRKEIRQTTLFIQKEIHNINKGIKHHEKIRDEYWGRYDTLLDEQYRDQDEYLRMNLETGICLGFVDDLVEHVEICHVTKQTLLQNTPIPEANIIYDIIQFL